MTRVEGVGRAWGSGAAPDKGTTGPLHIEELVWLAAEVSEISPLDVLADKRRVSSLARHVLGAYLYDVEGWTWQKVSDALGFNASTWRKNHGNFLRKMKGPNGYAELYETFRARVREGRMSGAAPGRGSFLQSVDPSRSLESEGS